MTDTSNTGFGKFVPGFDFLQNLAKGAAQNVPQLPDLANWVAPSLNLEDLEKRVAELKAVQFWLEQNSKVLGATIQALEVQKMTLATLKGMNFNVGDFASAFGVKASGAVASHVEPAGAAKAAKAAKAAPAVAKAAKAVAKPSNSAAAIPGLVDPLQLWGALTQQFQQIASSAMHEASKTGVIDASKNMLTSGAQEAAKSASKAITGAARPAARKATARRG